jgi:hypothetical protein
MSGGYISFFNASTALSDADLANALPDFQSQVSNEYNWFWGLNAYLDVNGGGSPITVVDYPGPTTRQERSATIPETETTNSTPSSSPGWPETTATPSPGSCLTSCSR